VQPCYQDLFETTDHRPLRFEGEFRDGCWVQGPLLSPDGTEYATVRDSIVSFVLPQDDPWLSAGSLESLFAEHGVNRQELIPANWKSGLERKQFCGLRARYLEEIVGRRGTILEVACGPGGGSIAEILTRRPEARILMNDIGRWMLEDWSNFLALEAPGCNVGFAQFDVTRCPIRSDSIDAADSSGGISNIPHNDRALAEVHRILKPGGILFMSDSTLDVETFRMLPLHEQEKWLEEFPDSCTGYETQLRSLGFNILEQNEGRRYPLDPRESTIAELGARHGITMYLRGFSVVAQKS
jgi:SAM-dependent methyltransferase